MIKKIFILFFFAVLFINSAEAQKLTKVKGIVLDSKTKEPLPFVNVVFKGKNIGTTTDFDGKFFIETQWGTPTLQASFVGYKTAAKKVTLGQMLFHETGLAINPMKELSAGTYACSSCHFASAGFQACRVQGIADGGIGFGRNGEGRDRGSFYPEDKLDVQPLRTPSAMNGAYQKNMLWNGQFGNQLNGIINSNINDDILFYAKRGSKKQLVKVGF
mgnify:CR=1 FL=1